MTRGNSGVTEGSSGKASKAKKHSWLVDFLIRLVKEKPLGTVGGIITLLLLLTGIFADFVAPYEMNQTHISERLVAPSAKFWLGSDNVGRDVLSRVIFGARVSVIVGIGASTLGTIISAVIGIVSGYIGGKLDLIVQRVVDAVLSMPGLIILMTVISIIGPGIWQVILVIGLTWGITGSRIIRGAVISIKENVYVQAAKATGCSSIRLLARHILPNVMAPVIILFTARMPSVIMAEASLSFLGFGIPPPVPSWGGMISGAGMSYMLQAPWMALWPGLALAIVVYGINMFGDAVRDLLDPRLRGGVGGYRVRMKKRANKRRQDM
jgi:peptide/nickel transport system permease protein